MADDFQEDIDAIGRIESVRTILDVVSRTTGMGFCAVARVTDDRWIACAVRDDIAFGLVPGSELKVATTICDEIRDHGRIVAIDHVAEDAQFCNHPTPQMYGFQSYISAPIYRTDGRFFGTLCAIDPRPAKVKTAAILEMFTLFGQLIALHLDALERVAAGDIALRDAHRTAELREQFIAVLGHDLRNPLASIGAATEVLRARSSVPQGTPVLDTIQRSVSRMSELISNILDFARGRLGGGLSITRAADVSLQSTLEQVVAELQLVWPGRPIMVDLAVHRPVACDRERIGQLFSNLLANALAHGDARRPVYVGAQTGSDGLVLSVANGGAAIPTDTLAQLFQPFSRSRTQAGGEGLGLGLYIASEIARAHGGTLAAESSGDETRFTFRMPAAAA